MAPTVSEQSSRVIRGLLVVALLATVPYVNALQAGFTLDDEPMILENSSVTGPIDLTRIFATPLFGILYRPLTVLTYALNQATSPGKPFWFHATNVALHVAVTVLVFLLSMQLCGSTRVSAIAAALFAVHPVHTEAVTSIVGRAEVLASLFGLLSILAAIHADKAMQYGSQIVLRCVSIVCFLLALLSKESAVTLIPLISVCRIGCRGEPVGAGLWREIRSLDWIPYAVCVVVFMGFRYQVLSTVDPPYQIVRLDNVLAFVSPLDRVRTAIGIVWDYFGLLNVPIILAADYSYNQIAVVDTWLNPRLLAGGAMLIAAGVTAVWHRQPFVRCAVVFPLVALSLTANLLFVVGTVKAERFLYLPSVGWVLIVAFAGDSLLRSPRYRFLATGALAIVVVGFGIRTWQRNWDWKDNWTLYRSMVQTAPRSAKARHNYGVSLQQHGHDDAAVEQFRAALDIYPGAEAAALGIGIAMARQGQDAAAVTWYARALAIQPAYAMAHTYLCAAYLRDERYAAAATACRNGLRYHPTDPDLLKGLGFSLIGMNDGERGRAVLRRALTLNAADTEVQTYLAQADAGTCRASDGEGPNG